MRDVFHQTPRALRVAKAWTPIRDASFLQLHGEGYREAKRDRIEAVLIRVVVGAQNPVEIHDAEVWSKSTRRFLVNPAGSRVQVTAIERVDDLDAVVRAARAGAM